MFVKTKRSTQILFLMILAIILGMSACFSNGAALSEDKYISIDKIQAGMKGYCLTVFEGTKIERFELEVLSVMRNINPGGEGRSGSRNAILIKCLDERFVHNGVVAGCSGSPVYIDGKLAGALAFGWTFSKDPIYGVTPIDEMIGTTDFQRSQSKAGKMNLSFDYSKPIDLAHVGIEMKVALTANQSGAAGVSALLCPVVISGVSASACGQLNSILEPMGLFAVEGTGPAGAVGADAASVKLEPGACLGVPLVSGDISMTVVGTVTEVVDKKVYGFGHGFLSFGGVELPMATAQVYSVIPSVFRSFKLAAPIETVGSINVDCSTAVSGTIGTFAKTIPLVIKVERYNDSQKRAYNCRIVNNRMMTGSVLGAAVGGAVYQIGELPPEHMIEYKVGIARSGGRTINFSNVSTSQGLNEVLMESVNPLVMVMNNPYNEVGVESITYDIKVVPKNIISHIWSAEMEASKFKSGGTVNFEVVTETMLAGKKKYPVSIKIPEQLASGKYEIYIFGAAAWQDYLRKNASQRFLVNDLDSLIEAINNIVSIKKDKLYCVLNLPAGGITMEGEELPNLPGTKAMLLIDPKRTLASRPYQNWVLAEVDVDSVIVDNKVMNITVEKQ